MLPSYDWGVERMETMLVSYKALALLFLGRSGLVFFWSPWGLEELSAACFGGVSLVAARNTP